MRRLLSLIPLYSCVVLLVPGTGLLATLLGLRAQHEGMGEMVIGVLGSAYFAGLSIGVFVCSKIIHRIGHIRALGLFGGLISVSVLLQSMWVQPIAWIVLRMLTGLAVAGFYTVIESWLNGTATAESRGVVFAVYMTTNQLAQAMGQQFLHVAPITEGTLFSIVAILATVGLMPVLLTSLPSPQLGENVRVNLRRLWQAAPLAFLGALVSGLVLGTFWSLGPVFAQSVLNDQSRVAFFMTLVLLVGAFMQFPIGYISDRIARHRALFGVAAIASAGAVVMVMGAFFPPLTWVGAVVFGIGAFGVYPVSVVYLVNCIESHEILACNAGMLLLNGIGAVIAPLIVSALMSSLGNVFWAICQAVFVGGIAFIALRYQTVKTQDT